MGLSLLWIIQLTVFLQLHVQSTYYYRLYAEAKGSMGFIIPEDFMMSEGIINTVDLIG